MHTNSLPMAAQIAIALNLHKAPQLRQIALTVVARYIKEFHLYGVYTEKDSFKNYMKLCKRFKLNDFACAMQAHFPAKFL